MERLRLWELTDPLQHQPRMEVLERTKFKGRKYFNLAGKRLYKGRGRAKEDCDNNEDSNIEAYLKT